jgi:GT2 family glycosyltransferase
VTYTIAALVTCHNRRDTTLACIRSLRSQASSLARRGFQISLFLVDDACTDGTAESVLSVWPDANIRRGSGSLFWCGGMRKAWQHAEVSNPDYYLLLNDDTILRDQSVIELLTLAPTPEERLIAVAAIADPRNGNVVFGGHRGHDLTPVAATGRPEVCDTMNANCALIPRAVYQAIGILCSAYTHSMGDFDYGFLATRSGIPVVQSANVLGISEPNSEEGSWRDSSLSRLARLKLLWFSPTKGLPFFEWCRYCNYGCSQLQ